MPNISNFLQTIKLPVMPEVARALIQTLNDEDADVVSVRNVIAKDPTLTAVLLRMANSAIFGLSRSVTSLDSAVSVVGMSQIRARALSISISSALSLPAGLNRLEFWRYCMVCAGYSKWVASNLGMDEQQAWLTGMMLHLGQVMIAQHSPHQLQMIEAQPRQPGERWQRQRLATGFDEGQIMAEVAMRWDFPEEIVNALRHAANPLEAQSMTRLACVVHLAGTLADNTGSAEAAVTSLPSGVMNAISLDLERLKVRVPSAESLNDTSMLQI